MNVTSLANIHHMVPIDCTPLLLHGIATSTYFDGESVLHKAITGKFTYEASVIAWWSNCGSVATKSRGSRNAFWI